MTECSLGYFAPDLDKNGKPVAKIMKSEIEKNAKKWKNTLIGSVMGEKSFLHLKICVSRIWKPKG